jgi:uncharacterized protein (TIRG00374 family)
VTGIPSHETGRRTAARLWRWPLGIALIAMTAWLVDPQAMLLRLRGADAGWIAAALALSLPSTLLMAWRWHFTAQRIGARIGMGAAVREYYVSLLVNQIVPGGVAGDFARVVRQAPLKSSLGPVARSVVLERMVGQLALWLVVSCSAIYWGALGLANAVFVVLAGVGALVVGLVVWMRSQRFAKARARSRVAGALDRFVHDARLAVFGPAAGVQLVASVVIVLVLIATFYCCARAVGVPMTASGAMLVVPWVLAATTIPLTVGGWGVREATAAGVFELVGLSPAAGTAASVAFGVVSLVAALPGVWWLVRAHRHEAAQEDV